MHNFKKFIDSFMELSDDSYKEFESLFTKGVYKKNEIVFNKNNPNSEFFVILEGVARSVILDKDGNEKTRSIFIAPSIFGSPERNYDDGPSIAEINCLSDAIIYKGNFKRFLEMTYEKHDFALLYGRLMEFAFKFMKDKATNLAIFDATERYLDLRKRFPNLEDEIQQNHIASFLNITPIQLSRIRKKLQSDNKI